jgi:hypothetical protein
MPEKQRDDHLDIVLHVSGTKTGGIPFGNSVPAKLLRSFESIKGPNSGYGVGYNPVDHKKWEWSTAQGASVNLITAEDNHINAGYLLLQARYQRGGVPFAQDLADLCTNVAGNPGLNHRAFRSMVGRIRIPRYLSILNFLLELKDFTRMFEFWTLRRGKLGNIANGILNEEFGWRPFLDDVCAILKGLKQFHKKLKKFMREQHEVHVTHYKKILTEDNYVPHVLTTSEPSVLESGTFYRNENFVQLDVDAPEFFFWKDYIIHHLRAPEYIATMKYTYHIPLGLDTLRETVAWLDAFGVYWDPQVLWNAIPFSFIVDWFFNVGDWLHQKLSKPNYPVKLRVIDFCISVKADCLMEGSVRIPLSTLTVPIDDPGNIAYFNMQDRSRVYKRIVCVPYTDDPLMVLDPMKEIKHLVLALALGHNCARPRKRWQKPKKGFDGGPG